eukprot:TRINITY_DN15824_c0_g2_i1.p1 TRINITY_DN15824_c0_g2~~TRINITY_DN15824_c0_g2_i1.p1  ORF type:complete len:320 (-),score=81.66 TRINITY_DN15824_c0_g2_i1:186-1145(-)
MSETAIQIRSYYKAGVFERELLKLRSSQPDAEPIPQSPRSPVSVTSPRSSVSSPGSPREVRAAMSEIREKDQANQDHQATESNRRGDKLREIYHEFDLDSAGDVGFDELLLLGQTRRKLGQKQGAWTREMNRNLMDKMGTDRNGNVAEDNFVDYFNSSLTRDPATFDSTMEQFLECARACRVKKIEKREAENRHTHFTADQDPQIDPEAGPRAEAALRQRAVDEATRQRAARERAAAEEEIAKQTQELMRRRAEEQGALERDRADLEKRERERVRQTEALQREREAFDREKAAWAHQQRASERQLAIDLRRELLSLIHI